MPKTTLATALACATLTRKVRTPKAADSVRTSLRTASLRTVPLPIDTHKLWEFNHAPSRSGCGPPHLSAAVTGDANLPHLSAALTSLAPAPNGRFLGNLAGNLCFGNHRRMVGWLDTSLDTSAWIPPVWVLQGLLQRVLQPLVYRPKRVNRSVNFGQFTAGPASRFCCQPSCQPAPVNQTGDVGLLPLSGGRCRRITGPLPAQWPGGLASWASAQFCAQLRRGVFPQKGENPCSGGLASWVSVQFCTHADPPKYGIRPHFNCCRYDHSYPAQWPGGVAN